MADSRAAYVVFCLFQLPPDSGSFRYLPPSAVLRRVVFRNRSGCPGDDVGEDFGKPICARAKFRAKSGLF